MIYALTFTNLYRNKDLDFYEITKTIQPYTNLPHTSLSNPTS